MAAPYYDEGLHVGEIVSQGLSKAKTGTLSCVIRVKILGIPDGPEFQPHKQQYERSIYWYITEKTMPFIVEKLQLLEFAGTKFSQIDPSNPYHVSLVGKQVDLWCKHEVGQNGQTQEKWDISNGGPKPLEALDAKEMRQLDSLFGKALIKPAAATPARATAPRNDDPGITDDDIPF